MPKNALCRKEFTNKDLGLQVRTIANEDGSISISAEGHSYRIWLDSNTN